MTVNGSFKFSNWMKYLPCPDGHMTETCPRSRVTELPPPPPHTSVTHPRSTDIEELPMHGRDHIPTAGRIHRAIHHVPAPIPKRKNIQSTLHDVYTTDQIQHPVRREDNKQKMMQKIESMISFTLVALDVDLDLLAEWV